MRRHWTEALEMLDACITAVEWAKAHPTLAEAWDACDRPDWMLWLISALQIQADREYRLFACWCVRRVWYLLSARKSKDAVKVAERYCEGKVTENELHEACIAAFAVKRGDVEMNAMFYARNAAWYTAFFDAEIAAYRASIFTINAIVAEYYEKRGEDHPLDAFYLPPCLSERKAHADKLREMFADRFPEIERKFQEVIPRTE